MGSARAESLLAYLLLHRGVPQLRQHLAFLLWPDSTEAQARTNLRHLLHNLRRMLPQTDRYVDIGADAIQVRPDAPVSLDVAGFEAALAEGRLADGVNLYAGDLLPGRYDEWLLEERERLHRAHLEALERLAAELESEGRWGEAVTHAERLARADPLRESTHRLLMRLHAREGDRARALRAFHVCATTLQRELGVAPSHATRADYERLLGAADLPASEPSPPAVPALVGRAGERERLADLWRSAATGAAHLVLVTGEAGIGKSRLLEELRSWCAYRGAATAEARAYAAEGELPYGPVVEWLRADPVVARLPRLAHAHARELARLLPELTAAGDPPATSTLLTEDEQRRRLFDAVGAALLAVEAPLLLVADDLHLFDAQTLQLLHYLLRTRPRARLLVAASARLEDVDPDHPLHELTAGLVRLGRLTDIALHRLDRGETAALAVGVAGRPLEAAVVDRLHADSEGIPLFLIEAVRTAEGGRLPTTDAPQVQAVLTARLSRLTPLARELAGVAATIGRAFSTAVVAAVSDLTEPDLVAGLDELWRRGLVRAHGPDGYDFSHGRIRDAVYDQLSPAQRRHHHRRAAEVLQQPDLGDARARSGEIAVHYEAAGAAGDAARWYLAAADAAQRRTASADAVRLLERGLALLDELPAGPLRAELELRLLTALPAPLIALDGYLSPRVAEAHRRALAVVGELGGDPDPPLLRSLAMAHLSRGDFVVARTFGEELRGRAERDGDDVLWVESAYVLGVAAFWQGQLEAARREFAAALDRYRLEHRAAHLLRYGQDPAAFCGLRLAYTLWLLGRDHEAAAALHAALAAARESRHPFTRTSTIAWAGLLALDQHDERRLRDSVSALADESTVDLAGPARAFAAALRGFVEVIDGRADAGVRRAHKAFTAARAGEPAAPGLVAMHVRILLEAAAAAGDARTGLVAAEQALSMGAGAQLWEAEARRLRAGFLASRGEDPDAVLAELRRAAGVAGRQGAEAFRRRIEEMIESLAASSQVGRSQPERHAERSWNGRWPIISITQLEGARDVSG